MMEETGIDLAKVVIELIEIDVRGEPWDALRSDDRIQPLYKTYQLLKGSCPEITRQVRFGSSSTTSKNIWTSNSTRCSPDNPSPRS